MMDPLFETERLAIRRFTHGDIRDVLEFTAHASVARETPNVPRGAAKLAGYIDTQNAYELFAAKECIDLAIERKSDRKVIGLLSLVSDGQRQAEIGWALGVDHRGRGYVTEAARALISYAFDVHKYHRVFAGTVFTNTFSWRVMERLGMQKEAHFVQAHVSNDPDGKWIDTVRYAVLASEWPRQREKAQDETG